MKLSDEVAKSITELIITENLSAGDKLPNEYDLAKRLNVSRSTLREAVRSLKSKNILEVRHGSGTYISKNIGIVDDPFGFKFVDNTLKLTEDLFTLRYILEPEVAMLAAQYRTEEDIISLEKLSNDIEDNVKNFDDSHIKLDMEFHSLIAKMSGNIGMFHLIPVINQSITLYNDYYTNEQSKSEMIESHRNLVKNIREKNPIEARYSMQKHILNIINRLNF